MKKDIFIIFLCSLVYEVGLSFDDISKKYVPLSTGVQVEKKCYDQFDKNEFEKNINETIREGLSCLIKLNTLTAHEHVDKFLNMLGNEHFDENLKIICSDEKDKFETISWDALAFASEENEEPFTSDQERRPTHPYISLRPSLSLMENDLKKLLFHEFFHNHGYRHGSDREYPNACEECCFTPNEWTAMNPTEQEIQRQKLACLLCGKDYSNLIDYFQDATLWVGSSSDSWIIMAHLMKSIQKNELWHEGEFLLYKLMEQNLPGILNYLGQNSLGSEVEDDDSHEVLIAKITKLILNNQMKNAAQGLVLLKSKVRNSIPSGPGFDGYQKMITAFGLVIPVSYKIMAPSKTPPSPILSRILQSSSSPEHSPSF